MVSQKSKQVSLALLWSLVINVITVIALLFILALYKFVKMIMVLFIKPKHYGTRKDL
jgi:hypothetical protein